MKCIKRKPSSALLFIEFQYEWLSEQGKLQHLFADKAPFLESLAKAERIITAARHVGMPILHSGLNYSKGYQELGVATYGLRKAITTHQTFLVDAEGSQFVGVFKPQQEEFVVSGRTGASAFAGSNLDSYLRNNRITTLYLLGYAMHVCVESTLRAAHDLGYEVILIEDASAAFTSQQEQHVLNHVVPHFGGRITAQNFLKQLSVE